MKAFIYRRKLKINPESELESIALKRWFEKEKDHPMVLTFSKKNYLGKRLTDPLLRKVLSILNGIDKCELFFPTGWWETSEGAEFGRKKIELIKNAFEEFESK